MDNQIAKANNININGTQADPKRLVYILNKTVSQSEYGEDFCKTYYGKPYIDGLIDTVRDDYQYTKKVISRAKKALHSRSINVKNRYLHSMNNDRFDKFVGYDKVRDANHDIKYDIHNNQLVLKQLNKYSPDAIVELSGDYKNCIHPLSYSKVRNLIKYDYIK